MTDEQIKQNADEYAKQFLEPYDGEYAPIKYVTAQMAYIAGAHSRDEEISLLNKEADMLLAAYKKLRNPWISVEERMPPSQVEVLLYDTAGYYRTGYWHECFKRWCGRDVPQFAVITHWCHLPKRPENRADFAQNSYFY